MVFLNSGTAGGDRSHIFELALEYYREGLLGDDMIEGYVQGIRPLFEDPLVVEWWEAEGQGLFTAEFRDLVAKQPAA